MDGAVQQAPQSLRQAVSSARCTGSPLFLRQIQTRLVRGNFLIRGIYHPQTALRAGNALNSLNVLFAAALIIR